MGPASIQNFDCAPEQGRLARITESFFLTSTAIYAVTSPEFGNLAWIFQTALTVVALTLQAADLGDTTTMRETLVEAGMAVAELVVRRVRRTELRSLLRDRRNTTVRVARTDEYSQVCADPRRHVQPRPGAVLDAGPGQAASAEESRGKPRFAPYRLPH